MKTFTFIIYLEAICCVFAIYKYDESTKITNDGIVESSHLYRKKSNREDVELVPHRLRQVKDENPDSNNVHHKSLKRLKNEKVVVYPYSDFDKLNDDNLPQADAEIKFSEIRSENSDAMDWYHSLPNDDLKKYESWYQNFFRDDIKFIPKRLSSENAYQKNGNYLSNKSSQDKYAYSDSKNVNDMLGYEDVDHLNLDSTNTYQKCPHDNIKLIPTSLKDESLNTKQILQNAPRVDAQYHLKSEESDSSNFKMKKCMGNPERNDMIIEDDENLINVNGFSVKEKNKQNKKYERIHNYNKKYNNANVYKVNPETNSNKKQYNHITKSEFEGGENSRKASAFSVNLDQENPSVDKTSKHHSLPNTRIMNPDNRLSSKSSINTLDNERISHESRIGDIDFDISKMLNSINLFTNFNGASKFNKDVHTTKKAVRYEVSSKDVEEVKKKICKDFNIQKGTLNSKTSKSKSYTDDAADNVESVPRLTTTINEGSYTRSVPRRSPKTNTKSCEPNLEVEYKYITEPSATSPNLEDELHEFSTSSVNADYSETSLQSAEHKQTQKRIEDSDIPENTNENYPPSTYLNDESSLFDISEETSLPTTYSKASAEKIICEEETRSTSQFVSPKNTVEASSNTESTSLVSSNNEEEEKEKCNSEMDKDNRNKNLKKQRINRVYLTINPILTNLEDSDKSGQEIQTDKSIQAIQRKRKKVKNHHKHKTDDDQGVTSKSEDDKVSKGNFSKTTDDNSQFKIQFVNDQDDSNGATPVIYLLDLDVSKKYHDYLIPNEDMNLHTMEASETTVANSTLIGGSTFANEAPLSPTATTQRPHELIDNTKKNRDSSDNSLIILVDDNMVPRTTPKCAKSLSRKCIKHKSRLEKKRKSTTASVSDDSKHLVYEGSISSCPNNEVFNGITTENGNSVHLGSDSTTTDPLSNLNNIDSNAAPTDDSAKCVGQIEITDTGSSNENTCKESNSSDEDKSIVPTINIEPVNHNFTASATVYTDNDSTNSSDMKYSTAATVIDEPSVPSVKNPQKSKQHFKSHFKPKHRKTTHYTTNSSGDNCKSNSTQPHFTTTTECPDIIDLKELADDAMETKLQQDQAAAVASSKVREELANRAKEAAEAANASVCDKQIIVNLLDELDSLFHLIRLLCNRKGQRREGYIFKQVDQLTEADDKMSKIAQNVSNILKMINDLKEETISNLECTKGRLLALRTKLSDEQKKLSHCLKAAEEAKCKKKKKKKKKFRLFSWMKHV